MRRGRGRRHGYVSRDATGTPGAPVVSGDGWGVGVAGIGSRFACRVCVSRSSRRARARMQAVFSGLLTSKFNPKRRTRAHTCHPSTDRSPRPACHGGTTVRVRRRASPTIQTVRPGSSYAATTARGGFRDVANIKLLTVRLSATLASAQKPWEPPWQLDCKCCGLCRNGGRGRGKGSR